MPQRVVSTRTALTATSRPRYLHLSGQHCGQDLRVQLCTQQLPTLQPGLPVWHSSNWHLHFPRPGQPQHHYLVKWKHEGPVYRPSTGYQAWCGFIRGWVPGRWPGFPIPVGHDTRRRVWVLVLVMLMRSIGMARARDLTLGFISSGTLAADVRFIDGWPHFRRFCIAF